MGLLLFSDGNEIFYFDSFGVEHILEEIKYFIGNKNIKASIYHRVQGNQSCVVTFVSDSLILYLQIKN